MTKPRKTHLAAIILAAACAAPLICAHPALADWRHDGHHDVHHDWHHGWDHHWHHDWDRHEGYWHAGYPHWGWHGGWYHPWGWHLIPGHYTPWGVWVPPHWGY